MSMKIKIVRDGSVCDVSLSGLLLLLFGRKLVDDPLQVQEFGASGDAKGNPTPQPSKV